MGRIEDWLDRAGLGAYIERFAENDIDEDVIDDLTDADLRELGLPLGARKRFLKSLPFAPVATSAQPVTTEAERRQVTVVFCDLVDSTPLAERLDPEELKTLLESYQDICREVVARYDGFIARYSGDGILIYFGYPRAHEGDTQRAVYAALDIVEAIGARADLGVEVHIGIHTGLVVAGDTREKAAITGETPNIAARIEGLAGAGEVLLSATAQSLVEPYVVTEPLGRHELKGVSEPIDLYLAKSRREAYEEVSRTSGAGLPPLIGRDGEQQLLMQKWALATEGEPQFVVVTGEPGVGKTRLVRSLGSRAYGKHERLVYFCSAFHRNSAFFPIISELERVMELSTISDEDARRAKLSDFARSLGIGSKTEATFEQLLGLTEISRSTSQQFGDSVTEGLIETITSLTRLDPLLFIVEDVHWADPSTTEVLQEVIEALEHARVMMVVTMRPEALRQWAGLHQVTSLTLTPLGREDSIKLVESTGAHGSLARQIAKQADGVPLFLEELAKSALATINTETETAAHLEVPTSLRDALMARLDALGEQKDLAQVASIFGRRCDAEAIAFVADCDSEVVESTLTKLVDLDFLVRRRVGGDRPVYDFRHALIRDLAYESLLQSKRRHFHARAAEMLTKDGAARVKPEVLAWHFEHAGQIDSAIEQLRAAAEASIRLAAHSEAAQHIQQAINLLYQQDPSPQRDEREFHLRLLLGPSLMIVGGYASEKVDENYSLARQLYEGLPDRGQLFQVLNGLYEFQMVSGNLPGGEMLAEEILSLGEENDNALQILIGLRSLSTIYILQGKFPASFDLTTLGLEQLKLVREESAFRQFGHDPRVALYLYRGWALAVMGRLAEARESGLAAIQVAERIEEPMSLGFALCYNGIILNVAGYFEEARGYIDQARALCAQQQMPLWDALSTIQLGWSELLMGDASAGLELSLKGIQGWLATGARSGSTFFHTSVADCLAAQGDFDGSGQHLAAAASFCDDTGELFQLAEIQRIRALAEPKLESRRFHLDEALKMAKNQGATLSELKTASALFETESTQAHEINLRRLLDGFDEDETSVHVQRARKLLDR